MEDGVEAQIHSDVLASTTQDGIKFLQPTPSTDPMPVASAPPLSKSQLKKQRRKQQWEDGREDRKAKRKEKIKQKKIQKREAKKEQAQNGHVTKSAGGSQDKTSKTKTFNGGTPQTVRQRATQLPLTIVFDCQFDELMTEGEIMSLGSQLTRCYSDNKKSPFRAHLVVSSFGGRLKERFEGILESHHHNWKGVRFMEEDWTVAAERAEQWMKGEGGGVVAGVLSKASNGKQDMPETPATEVDQAEPPLPEAFPVEIPAVETTSTEAPVVEEASKVENTEQPTGEIIYLSSDSDETLTELKPYSTYIIGGLVDRNRHKGICHKRALDAGVRTAKLPIGEFLQMSTRSVLATNHVSEIMLKWLEIKDWGKAFMEVIPKRKGGVLKQQQQKGSGAGGGIGENNAKNGGPEEQERSVDEGSEDSDEEMDDVKDVKEELLGNKTNLEAQGQTLKRKHEEEVGDAQPQDQNNVDSKRAKDEPVI